MSERNSSGPIPIEYSKVLSTKNCCPEKVLTLSSSHSDREMRFLRKENPSNTKLWVAYLTWFLPYHSVLPSPHVNIHLDRTNRFSTELTEFLRLLTPNVNVLISPITMELDNQSVNLLRTSHFYIYFFYFMKTKINR